MATEQHGGCVCGAVRFTTAGAPLRATVCHCRWCQRRTGTAFGTEVVFADGQVRFAGIEPSRYRHVSDDSGRWLDVEFCPRCGSNLGFTLQAAPGLRAVPAGTFDEADWIDPQRLPFKHVFVRSRRAWGDLSPLVEAHETHFRN